MLQIMLYHDEVEVCNPPGIITKIHNLGVFQLMCVTMYPIVAKCPEFVWLLTISPDIRLVLLEPAPTSKLILLLKHFRLLL